MMNTVFSGYCDHHLLKKIGYCDNFARTLRELITRPSDIYCLIALIDSDSYLSFFSSLYLYLELTYQEAR